MKKYDILLICLVSSFLSFGGDSDLFQVNEEVLQKEFSELILLETKIEKGEDVSMMMNIIELEQIIEAPTKSQDFEGLEFLACCFSDIGIELCTFGISLLEDLYEWIFYKEKKVQIQKRKEYNNGHRHNY